VLCKGAPDRVLDMCGFINDNGVAKPMDDEVRSQVMDANSIFANLGRRVLAFS